jgi:exosome complex RNA-binding protein Csl4
MNSFEPYRIVVDEFFHAIGRREWSRVEQLMGKQAEFRLGKRVYTSSEFLHALYTSAAIAHRQMLFASISKATRVSDGKMLVSGVVVNAAYGSSTEWNSNFLGGGHYSLLLTYGEEIKVERLDVAIEFFNGGLIDNVFCVQTETATENLKSITQAHHDDTDCVLDPYLPLCFLQACTEMDAGSTVPAALQELASSGSATWSSCGREMKLEEELTRFSSYATYLSNSYAAHTSEGRNFGCYFYQVCRNGEVASAPVHRGGHVYGTVLQVGNRETIVRIRFVETWSTERPILGSQDANALFDLKLASNVFTPMAHGAESCASPLEVLSRYTWALDTGAFNLLDACYTDDCEVTYAMDTTQHHHGPAEVIARLRANRPKHQVMQHYVSNPAIHTRLGAIVAEIHCCVLTRRGPATGGDLIVAFGTYDIHAVATPSGWRFKRFIYTRGFALPAGF